MSDAKSFAKKRLNEEEGEDDEEVKEVRENNHFVYAWR